jgi:hypothetical protein
MHAGAPEDGDIVVRAAEGGQFKITQKIAYSWKHLDFQDKAAALTAPQAARRAVPTSVRSDNVRDPCPSPAGRLR